MHTRLSFVIGSGILALCVSASAAWADPIIDFGTGSAGAGGTLSYAGGSSPMVGANVPIGFLIGLDTPVNDGGYFTVGDGLNPGLLNFTTGSYQGYSDGLYHFGPGGSFEIAGNVPDAGIVGPGTGPTLISGGIDDGNIGKSGLVNMATSSGGSGIAVNSALLDLFGLSPEATFTIFSTEMATGSIGTGEAFSLSVFHSDWQATDPPAAQIATPEPVSLVLLGSGLIALGTATRRRSQRPGARGAQTRRDANNTFGTVGGQRTG